MELKTVKNIEIRFSEVDAMQVVWHGSYMLYFEDAREAFGKQWGLGYDEYIENRIFAPVVDISFHYKKAIKYGDRPVIEIVYRPTEAAKIIFDYRIYNPEDGSEYTTGRSVQVFMDSNYSLMWECPPFYTDWKKKHNLL